MSRVKGKRVAVWVALGVLALFAGGCSAVGEYAEARLLDLWDVVPTSVRYGPGAKVTVNVTQFLGTGIGFGTSRAVGMAPGRFGPAWEEGFWHIPILASADGWLLSKDKEGAYSRWPGASYRSSPRRNIGHILLVFPVALGGDGFFPILEPWHSWANVELDAFAGVGLRVGFCPDELVDFLTGLFGLDILGDDPLGEEDQPDQSASS